MAIDNSFSKGKMCVTAKKYSSDTHLLSLVFGNCVSDALKAYSVIHLVTDIKKIDAATAEKKGAYIILCDLNRYSDQDLAQLIENKNSHNLALFVITPGNASILSAQDVYGGEHSSLLALQIPPIHCCLKSNHMTRQALSINLHSDQLALDPALLLPQFSVPSERPHLEKSKEWISRRTYLPMLRRLRYPLAMTKRHLKNCLRELRAPHHDISAQPTFPVNQMSEPVGERLQTLELNGTVFLAVFEKFDYASDWSQLVSAFCMTLKKYGDATLLLWVTSEVSPQNRANLHHILCTAAPFSCSVALLEGEISYEDLQTIFSGAHFLLNTEMYSSPRLDMLYATTRGLPIISSPNSVFRLLNQEFIWCALEVDARPASPDKSDSHRYTTWQLKVNWQDLSERILQAYQLKQRTEAYENLRELQLDRYRKLVGRHLIDSDS